MVNWIKLAKKIPDNIQVGAKSYYTILHVEKCPNGAFTAGETDPNTKVIYIRINQTNKQKVLTYLHEVLHAYNFEHEVGLTEKQVSLLEKKMFYYVLKGGNIFNG